MPSGARALRDADGRGLQSALRRRAARGTLCARPYPAPPVPFRRLLLALACITGLPPGAQPAQAQPAVDALRAAGNAQLAFGSDSLAAVRLDRATHLDRRHAPTYLALALALDDADRAAARRALDRAERYGDTLSGVWEARLRDLRRPPAAQLFSMTDSRRTTAARRLVALDSGSALGRAELAERDLQAFRYNRANARARGIWGRTSWQARRAWSAYANAEGHLGALLAADPRSAEGHRLSARLAVLADSAAAFDAAARRALAARPTDGHVWIRAAAAAWRARDADRADSLARGGLRRLGAGAAVYTSPARFVRPDDRAAWLSDSAGWADAFWRTRDARRLTAGNDRRLEHLARLAEADLLFRQAGLDEGDTEVPGWATDRGDTWVRYGPPLATRWWLVPGAGEFELWTYADFTLLFHDPWQGGRLDFASSAGGEDAVTQARGLANTLGERYDVTAGRRRADVTLTASAFRGAGGRTDLVVGYGVALAGEGAPPAVRSVAWARTPDGTVLSEAPWADTGPPRDATVSVEGGRLWTHGAALAVAPGPVVLAAEAEIGDALGLVETEIDVRAFAGDGLQTSDLLLAAHIAEDGEAPPPGAVRRGDVWVQPLPLAAATTDAPLWAYLELYGLARDAGRTRYEVEARLEPVAPGGALRRGLRRLLGRERRTTVAAAVASGGTTPDDTVALLLDVSGQRAGLYRLTLAVRDRVAGTQAEAARTLLLDPPR